MPGGIATRELFFDVRTDEVFAPASRAAAAYTSAAIDTKNSGGLHMLCHVGAVAAGATLDLSVTDSDTSGGAYVAIAGVTVTQMIAAGLYEIKIGKQKHRQFVKVTATVGVDAIVFGLAALRTGLEASDMA